MKSAALIDVELQERHEHVPADYYDRGVRRNLLQWIWHQRRQQVIKFFLRKRGGRLLDLGCHGGYLTRIIQKVSGAQVTGIDISTEAIAYARSQLPKATFVVGDLQDSLPFPDASFDTITAFDVLEHVPRLNWMFEEVRRVLVPGGTLVIGVPLDTRLFRTVWALWTRLWGAAWKNVHVHDFNADVLRELAAQHGFSESRRQVSHWGMYLVAEFVKRA